MCLSAWYSIITWLLGTQIHLSLTYKRNIQKEGLICTENIESSTLTKAKKNHLFSLRKVNINAGIENLNDKSEVYLSDAPAVSILLGYTFSIEKIVPIFTQAVNPSGEIVVYLLSSHTTQNL